LVGTIAAYVLVGAFIGVLGWKLTEAAAETRRLEGFQRPDVAVAPPPAPAQPVADGQLAAVLQRQTPSSGTVGLYVKNLTTGAEAHVNGDRVFPAASLYKLPILAEVERQVKLRRLTPEQQVTVSREHWVPGSGVLQARVGDSLPVGELLRLMIVESDNIAAMMLLDVVGLENVNQSMRSVGLRATRLLDFRAPGAYGGPGPYTTTAADMGLLLDVVASGQLVDGEGSEDALRLLEKKQANEWLGDGLPWWVKVAHKWGEVPGARHDAGVVFTPRGQWVIVVMTEGLDANRSGGYIRDVSRAVFNYFDGSR
jgi:beta-lactamase class A